MLEMDLSTVGVKLGSCGSDARHYYERMGWLQCLSRANVGGGERTNVDGGDPCGFLVGGQSTPFLPDRRVRALSRSSLTSEEAQGNGEGRSELYPAHDGGEARGNLS